jgi:shikimate kinase
MSLESSRNIGLIGFMASGKTVVGRALATGLDFKFIDTDDVIEERIGKSISDIFAEEGEDIFRKIEGEVVQEVCRSNSQVISFGGGAVLSSNNISTIRNNATVILLTASLDSISSRIKLTDYRPLLDGNDVDLEINIQNLLAHRDPYYTNAMDFKISTDGKSVTDIVSEIMGRLQH